MEDSGRTVGAAPADVAELMSGHGAALRTPGQRPGRKDQRKRLVSRRVTLKFPHFGQLVSAQTTNFSMTGMFAPVSGRKVVAMMVADGSSRGKLTP